MLGIDFIRKENDLSFSLAGMEFMDFQKQDRYLKLVEFFKPLIIKNEFGWIIDWVDSEQKDLSKLIMEMTGIKVRIIEHHGDSGDLAIDTGYVSPNSVMNRQGTDGFLSTKHSKVSQAFKCLNVDVLKGWCDPKTGMVGGDFSKIEFDIHVERYLEWFVDVEKINKQVSIAEAFAMFILHELGHAWNAFYNVWRTGTDILMQSNAIKMLAGTENTKEKIEIYKETLKYLEADAKVDDKLVNDLDSQDAQRAFFDKAINNRDLRRTLSLGTANRSSEMMADMYAIKMGCPKTLVIGQKGFYYAEGTSGRTLLASSLMTIAAIAVSTPLAIGVWGLITVVNFHTALHSRLMPGDEYDSPYRRIKAILRECVTEFSQNKKMKPADKQQFLAKCREIEKLVEENKPILEGTAFQRYIGWICSGTDFKAQEFEHYTAELVSHNLALYTDYFKES